MPEKQPTERQRYWRDHIHAAHNSNGTLVDYAKTNDLKVKDLYAWKTLLSQRGLLDAPRKSFVAIVPEQHRPADLCRVLFPNGIVLELSGGISIELIQHLADSK